MTEMSMVQLGQIADYLKAHYGIEIVAVEKKPEFDWVAELRERKILVNVSSRGIEGSIFIVAHVFGHMVQAAITSKYVQMLARIYEKGPPIAPDIVSQDEYFAYEREAYAFGRGLLARVMEVSPEMDRRYHVFMLTDLEYYWGYLITGKGGSQKNFDRLFAAKMQSAYPQLVSSMFSLDPPDVLVFRESMEISVV